MNVFRALDGSTGDLFLTFLIAHASNCACHILETTLALAYGRLHIADVPDLK